MKKKKQDLLLINQCGGINSSYRPHHRRWPKSQDEDVWRMTLIHVRRKPARLQEDIVPNMIFCL